MMPIWHFSTSITWCLTWQTLEALGSFFLGSLGRKDPNYPAVCQKSMWFSEGVFSKPKVSREIYRGMLRGKTDPTLFQFHAGTSYRQAFQRGMSLGYQVHVPSVGCFKNLWFRHGQKMHAQKPPSQKNTGIQISWILQKWLPSNPPPGKNRPVYRPPGLRNPKMLLKALLERKNWHSPWKLAVGIFLLLGRAYFWGWASCSFLGETLPICRNICSCNLITSKICSSCTQSARE